MKTVNQTLNASDGDLGHWRMWANDVQSRLNALRITPKRNIPVEYIPVTFTSTNGVTWHCQHLTTHTEQEEQYDYYMETVTGKAQPMTYVLVEVCDECGALNVTGEGDGWFYE